MTTIETLKFDRENLSIEDFMSLTEKEKENIDSIKIIPPKFINTGLDDFGEIQVKYKTPHYKTL
jgi:hypothetical protein